MTNNLKDLYLHKLEKAYDIESQLVVALGQLSMLATDNQLKAALSNHLEETKGHQEKIGSLLDKHGVTPSVTVGFVATMIEEANMMLDDIADMATKDAAIIAAGQETEHLEMALYGTLAEWADELDFEDDEDVLESILDEEKAADKKLNGLAEGGLLKASINAEAA